MAVVVCGGFNVDAHMREPMVSSLKDIATLAVISKLKVKAWWCSGFVSFSLTSLYLHSGLWRHCSKVMVKKGQYAGEVRSSALPVPDPVSWPMGNDAVSTAGVLFVMCVTSLVWQGRDMKRFFSFDLPFLFTGRDTLHMTDHAVSKLHVCAGTIHLAGYFDEHLVVVWLSELHKVENMLQRNN